MSSRQVAVNRDGYGGLRGVGQVPRAAAGGGGVDSGLFKPGQRPGLHPLGARDGGHAAPGHRLDIAGCCRDQVPVCGRRDYGLGQRVR